ncbi:MAG: hypothetical protein MK196_05850 [Acidimicrobiales bacterium]|nr:hypothetical protein [Acidimicrobiaceae bacterium]MCH2422615.1 hypothetical protein [Acidimicrobiales bacterium]
MHDIDDLERRGLPGVVVASDPFRDAVTAQSRALGLDVATAFTPHPVQDRTDAEMHAMADDVVGSVVAAITADPSL